MRHITQKKNLNCYSLSKDKSKSHFWLQGTINGARRGVLEKFVLFRYSLALTSIFIIKVDFPANTDILTYGYDKRTKMMKTERNLIINYIRDVSNII